MKTKATKNGKPAKATKPATVTPAKPPATRQPGEWAADVERLEPYINENVYTTQGHDRVWLKSIDANTGTGIVSVFKDGEHINLPLPLDQIRSYAEGNPPAPERQRVVRGMPGDRVMAAFEGPENGMENGVIISASRHGATVRRRNGETVDLPWGHGSIDLFTTGAGEEMDINSNAAPVPKDHAELFAETYQLAMRVDVLLNRLPHAPYAGPSDLSASRIHMADTMGYLVRELSEYRHFFDVDAARGTPWLDHDAELPKLPDAAQKRMDALPAKPAAPSPKGKPAPMPRHPQRTRDTLLPGSLVTFADGDKTGIVIAVGSNRSNKQGDSLLVLESLTGDVWPEFIDDCRIIQRAGTAPVPIDSLTTGGGGQGRVVGFVGSNSGKVGTIVVQDGNDAGLVYDPFDDERLCMDGWAELD